MFLQAMTIQTQPVRVAGTSFHTHGGGAAFQTHGEYEQSPPGYSQYHDKPPPYSQSDHAISYPQPGPQRGPPPYPPSGQQAAQVPLNVYF